MMKLSTLHPDHLLDGARRGALSPEAWGQLGAHLATCRACAWEHAATNDFARAHADPDAAQLGRLVDGALARAGLGSAPKPLVDDGGSATKLLTPVRSRSTMRWLTATAMVAAMIGAALVVALPARVTPQPTGAACEARLDAGALGPTTGGDS
jgi:hypothetical protein